ncbi:hypothetical protein AB4099_33965 [Bosea sp. 2KB_26]|uniref:hypothetical protein n=1 Tax=Bosea sp. 2KB_26 TaxID=3237475 RepID=UPI003F8FFA40
MDGSQEDHDEWYHDETEPWADPEIRLAYEAALGPFLVRFNEVDDRVSALLTLILDRQNQRHLIDRIAFQAQFKQKLVYLELLSTPHSIHDLIGMDFVELSALANERNIVAHGHFDQNPFDGNFELRGRGKRNSFDTAKFIELTRRCVAMAEKLGVATMAYWLDDIRIVPVAPAPKD